MSYYGDYYFWKKWRGAPWTRPSVGAYWIDDVMGSFGPFEMMVSECARVCVRARVCECAQVCVDRVCT